MDVVPVAEESLGVRSMALFVKASDVAVLFDAGLSLAPRRFGLPPHPRELQRARELRAKILEFAARADVITVSHYHRDHFTPWYESKYMATDGETYKAVYGGKLILAKSPEGINWSQRRRWYGFKKAVEPIARVEYADGRAFSFGNTLIKVSGPLPHGPEGSRTGYTLAFLIADGEERLLFMPDVQGPASEAAVSFALSVEPTIAIVGGPPLYLTSISHEAGVAGLLRLLDARGLHTLVIAHHALRELEWRERLAGVFEKARERGVAVSTYAGLLGVEEDLLEARRRELYSSEPAEVDEEREEDEE
jgi:predicted metallo-beta-lactamase superfamily hydrolase